MADEPAGAPETAAEPAPVETVTKPAKAAAASSSAAQDAKKARVAAAVRKWIDQNLRNTAFAQDTKAWNILQESIPALRAIIEQEV